MRSNRVGLPKEVKDIKDREVYSTEVWWEKEEEYMSLTSYVTKTKQKGNKNILVLSTFPLILGTEKDTGRKTPAVIVLYNFTKGMFCSKYCIIKSHSRVIQCIYLIRRHRYHGPKRDQLHCL